VTPKFPQASVFHLADLLKQRVDTNRAEIIFDNSVSAPEHTEIRGLNSHAFMN
jgi:hypothetical protein